MPPDEQVSLRDYMERVLEQRDQLFAARFDAQEEAVRLARASMDERLAKLNELRSEVLTDRVNYITRERYEADQKGIDGRFTVRAFAAGGGVALFLELLRVLKLIP